MSIDELGNLKQNIGQFISVNSFFSTSKNRETALFLLGDRTSLVDLERVLFEIDADPNVVANKPFADISSHSDFIDESEVLFMLGSIFHLQSIDHSDDELWIFRMTLCSDTEHALKKIFTHMKRQIGSGETNLRTLGYVLWDMSRLDLAERYFIRLLEQLLPNDPLHITLYEDLGKLASQSGNFDMSIEWCQKALTFREQRKLTINPNINQTNNSAGEFIGRSSFYLTFSI
jgi:tetratricopeptide (TPR) repeat protein